MKLLFRKISEARMLEKYCGVVVKWNDATYLAAFIERLDFLVEIYYVRHFCDSLRCSKYFQVAMDFFIYPTFLR